MRCDWWNSNRCVCVPQVSGGTVQDLLVGLRSVGESRALSVLEGALGHHDDHGEALGHRDNQEEAPQALSVQELKADVRMDSGVCDSGVELSAV